MIEVTSRHIECTRFNPNYSQMPAVAQHLLDPAAEAAVQKIVEGKVKFTKLHLTDQCNRSASIID